jgi:polar amino acid transport system substrate-binding protein
MKTSFRTGLLMGVGLFALAVAGVTFFRGSFGLADDTLTCVRRTGTLRIGYAVEAPYAFLGTNGEVTGESPEVARRIASRLGATRIV